MEKVPKTIEDLRGTRQRNLALYSLYRSSFESSIEDTLREDQVWNRSLRLCFE